MRFWKTDATKPKMLHIFKVILKEDKQSIDLTQRFLYTFKATLVKNLLVPQPMMT